MKKNNQEINRWRVRSGLLASTNKDGNNGAFHIPFRGSFGEVVTLTVVASDGMGWDHISVSLPHRCPEWMEMNFVKELFFKPEECVIQYHPPKSVYVNVHPNVLHLWKPQTGVIPMPPLEMI